MKVLPDTIVFGFGPEDKKLEISLHYTEKETVFKLSFADRVEQQSFTNIFGDPTVINLISNKDLGSLDEAYPDDLERARFVKGVLYTWAAVKLGHMDLLGVFSRLIDKKKLFEDYAHREMLEIVIVPVLRSIRDARRHLPDMPEAILVFSDNASREISEYLIHEVDRMDIFEEEEFQSSFKGKLNQVNATLAIRAVQALAASDIDKISEIGNTIQELQDKKVDVPEFQSLKEEFRLLCEKIQTLGNGNVQVIQTPPSPDFSALMEDISLQRDKLQQQLLEDISIQRENLQRELEVVKQNMKTMEEEMETKKKEIDEKIRSTAPVSQSDQQVKIVRNLSRKQMKVIEKMFSEE
jgi:hypothetical protein